MAQGYSVDAELKANASRFKRAINSARKVVGKFKSESEKAEDTTLDANTRPLKRNIKKAKKLMQSFTRRKAEKDVDADTTSFFRKVALLKAKAKALSRDEIVIPIKARASRFQQTMNKMATVMRSVGELAAHEFISGFVTLIPMLSPIIASLSGGVMGLATSFAAAGTGAVAFGSVAASALGDVFEANSDIKKLRDELAQTDDMEKRAEIMEEIEQATNGLSDSQKKALKSLQSFSKFWGKFAKQFQKPVVDIFARSLDQLKRLIKSMEPVFQGAVDAVNELSKAFGKQMQTKEFKDFINFLNENVGPAMEALGKSFGNMMQGVMNLMTAFAPLATDMQSGLVGMTEKFKNWTASLQGSEAFEKFINYVKENGPKVLELIGNLGTFLVELGKGMAPLGSKLLDLVNGFLSFANSLMKNIPLIGKVIAGAISLAGALFAVSPIIILLKTAFSGLAGPLVSGVARMIAAVARFSARMVAAVAKFVAQAAVFTAKVVATSAKFIARWALMGAKATLHAAKMAAAWTLATGKKMAVALAQMVATSAKFVAKWALIGAKSLLHAAKVAAAWVVAMGPVGWVITAVVGLVAVIVANWDKIWATTKKIFSKVANFLKKTWDKIWGVVKSVASKIWNYISNAFQKMYSSVKTKMNAVWGVIKSVWSFIKNSFSNALSFVSSLLKGDFEGMWQAVKDQMSNIKNTVSNIWGNVMDFLGSIDLFNMGMDIIKGLIGGVKDMAGDLVDSVKGVVDGAIEGAKSLLGIASPSKLFAEFGGFTFEGFINGMESMKSKVARSSKGMANAATKSFQPDMTLDRSQIMSSLSSLASTGMDKLQGSLNADISVGKQPIQITIKNEADAEWLRTFVNEENAVDSSMAVL